MTSDNRWAKHAATGADWSELTAGTRTVTTVGPLTLTNADGETFEAGDGHVVELDDDWADVYREKLAAERAEGERRLAEAFDKAEAEGFHGMGDKRCTSTFEGDDMRTLKCAIWQGHGGAHTDNVTMEWDDVETAIRKRAEPSNVNHPTHYTKHPSGVECIQITEHMSFLLGNVIKYVWRAGEKGEALEDLEKARWYLDREIANVKAASVSVTNSDERV